MNKSLLISLVVATAPLVAHESESDDHGPAHAAAKPVVAETGQPSPNSASAWVRAANALMQRSREETETHLFDQAETAYERALKVDPKNVEAMTGLAWVHNSRHEFAEGMSWAKKAIAAGAVDHMPYSLLGDAAVELGRYDDAYEYYQTGMDRSPNLSTYSRAAHLLWLTGNAAKGRMLMQKAIDAGGPYPENAAWCRAELALMLFHSGALLAAEEQAGRALKQAPANYHVLYVAGRIKMARKDYDQAADLLKKSVARNSGHGNHDALVALGDLYDLLGKTEESRVLFDQIVSMHTGAHSHADGSSHTHDGPSGNAQLARFYSDHNRDLDEALHQAELAYQAYPNVYAATTLAWCHYKKENYGDASKMIRKAMRFGTQDAAIYFRAGMIAARQGNRVEAQKQLARALSLNPHFNSGEAKIAEDMLKELAGQNAASVAVRTGTTTTRQ